MEWYAVHTRAGCERIAAVRLECELHLTVYIPEVLQRGPGVVQPGFLFPGYLFVLAAALPAGGELLAAIDRTPGCGSVVWPAPGSTDGHDRPASFSCDVIAWLRLRLAAIDQAGGLPLQVLRPGEAAAEPAPLPALAAALSGLHGPAARVDLLLHAAGQQQANGGHAAGEDECAPVARRLRRTRGHGRKIHYR